MFNFKWPYSNQYTLNLDWILSKVQEMGAKCDGLPDFLHNWLESHRGEIATTLTAPAYVNVRSFGAKGDGVTNDHDAIAAAIEAAHVSGGLLYFPKGTYRNIGMLKAYPGMCIAGDGPDNSIINHEGTCFSWVEPSPNVVLMQTVYRDIRLNGNKIGNGFEFVNASNFLFLNVALYNQDVGVYATGGNNVGFIQCWFQTQGSKGIWLGAKDSRVFIEHIDGVYLLGCNFGEIPVMIQNDGSTSTATMQVNSCQFYGYESYSDVCMWLSRTQGVSVENCWFEITDHVTAVVLANGTYEGVQTNINTAFTMTGSYVGSHHKIAIDHRDGSACTLISNTFINPSEYAVKSVDNQRLSIINLYYEGDPSKKCNVRCGAYMPAYELGATVDTTPPSAPGVVFTNCTSFVSAGMVYATFTCAVNGTVSITPPPLVTAYAQVASRGDGWYYANGVMDITGDGRSKTYMCVIPVKPM